MQTLSSTLAMDNSTRYVTAEALNTSIRSQDAVSMSTITSNASALPKASTATVNTATAGSTNTMSTVTSTILSLEDTHTYMFHVMGGVLAVIGVILVIVVVCFVCRRRRRRYEIRRRTHTKHIRRSDGLSGENRDGHAVSQAFNQPLYAVGMDITDQRILARENHTIPLASPDVFVSSLDETESDMIVHDKDTAGEESVIYENQHVAVKTDNNPKRKQKYRALKQDDEDVHGGITYVSQRQCRDTGNAKDRTDYVDNGVPKKSPMHVPNIMKRLNNEMKNALTQGVGLSKNQLCISLQDGLSGDNAGLKQLPHSYSSSIMPRNKSESGNLASSSSKSSNDLKELRHAESNDNTFPGNIQRKLAETAVDLLGVSFPPEYIKGSSMPHIYVNTPNSKSKDIGTELNISESKLLKRQNKTNKGCLNTLIPPAYGQMTNMTHTVINGTTGPAQKSRDPTNVNLSNAVRDEDNQKAGRELPAIAVIKPMTQIPKKVIKIKGVKSDKKRDDESVAHRTQSDDDVSVNYENVCREKRHLNKLHKKPEYMDEIQYCNTSPHNKALHDTPTPILSDNATDNCIENNSSSNTCKPYLPEKPKKSKAPIDQISFTQLLTPAKHPKYDSDTCEKGPDYTPIKNDIENSDLYIPMNNQECCKQDTDYIPMDYDVGDEDIYTPMDIPESGSAFKYNVDTAQYGNDGHAVMRICDKNHRDYISFIGPDKSNMNVYQNVASSAFYDYVVTDIGRNDDNETLNVCDDVHVYAAPNITTNTNCTLASSSVSKQLKGLSTNMKRTTIPVPTRPKLQSKSPLSPSVDEPKREQHDNENDLPRELSPTRIPRLQNKQVFQRENTMCEKPLENTTSKQAKISRISPAKPKVKSDSAQQKISRLPAKTSVAADVEAQIKLKSKTNH